MYFPLTLGTLIPNQAYSMHEGISKSGTVVYSHRMIMQLDCSSSDP